MINIIPSFSTASRKVDSSLPQIISQVFTSVIYQDGRNPAERSHRNQAESVSPSLLTILE